VVTGLSPGSGDLRCRRGGRSADRPGPAAYPGPGTATTVASSVREVMPSYGKIRYRWLRAVRCGRRIRRAEPQPPGRSRPARCHQARPHGRCSPGRSGLLPAGGLRTPVPHTWRSPASARPRQQPAPAPARLRQPAVPGSPARPGAWPEPSRRPSQGNKQRFPLASRQPVGFGQHRPQQLMRAGERKARLVGDTRTGQRPHPAGRLSVVTGPNGSGKSSLYRALRLLAGSACNGVVAALARQGGLESARWAGSPDGGRSMRRGRGAAAGPGRC
jgi:hypothetical protein